MHSFDRAAGYIKPDRLISNYIEMAGRTIRLERVSRSPLLTLESIESVESVGSVESVESFERGMRGRTQSLWLPVLTGVCCSWNRRGLCDRRYLTDATVDANFGDMRINCTRIEECDQVV